MGIDSATYDPPVVPKAEEQPDDDTPTSIEEVMEKFSNPEEIIDVTKIETFFQENINKSRLCISIPVTTEDDAARRDELHIIYKGLLRGIQAYIGINRENPIGSSLEGLIDEATSDIFKHTVLGERFNKIMVLVTKEGSEISFHLVNPARADVNLKKVDEQDSDGVYQPEVHGINMADGLRKSLIDSGCSVKNRHCVVIDEKGPVGVEQDVSIGLPVNLN